MIKIKNIAWSGWGRGLTMLMLALVLTGCGSGSDSDSDDSVADSGNDGGEPDAPTIAEYPAPATLEFFIVDEGGLYALAPSSPTATVLVDGEQGGKFDVSALEAAQRAEESGSPIEFELSVFAAASEVLPIVATEKDAQERVYPVPYQAYMFYRHKDGSYWRVSTDTDTFPPQPVRVSATETTRKICNYSLSTDLADPLNTAFVYGVLASGSSCTDAQRQVDYFVLRLSDDTTTVARDFPDPQPLTARQNSSDDNAPFDPRIITIYAESGRIAGWLIRQNDELVRLSRKAEVVARGIVPVNVFVAPLGQLDNGTVMLNIDGRLWAFDLGTNQATDLGYQFKEDGDEDGALTLDFAVVDGNRLFFQDYIDLNSRSPGNAVYRVAKNGEGDYTVEMIDRAEEPVTGLTGDIQIGQDRIVWYYLASNGTAADFNDNYFVLRSVSKTANGPIAGKVIASGAPDQQIQIPFWTSADRVFYNTVLTSDSQAIFGLTGEPVARSVGLNGSDETETLHALWAGIDTTRAYMLRVDNVMQIEGGIYQRELGGKPLKTVPTAQAGDPAAVINLGVLPNPATLQSVALFGGFGPGRFGILEIDEDTSSDTADTQYDLVYFDITEPGSVTRVMNTASKDELPIVGFGVSASSGQ